MVLANKKLVVIVSGGIAARKALQLVEALRSEQADVTTVVTRGALQLLHRDQLHDASGGAWHHRLFGEDDTMSHIDLVRDCDAIVVAPASAHFLAKMAHGMADCLASTLLLANRGAPVFVAPGMNGWMWRHEACRANCLTLRRRGVHFFEPHAGRLACGDYDEGRMMEVADMMASLTSHFTHRNRLRGLRAVVTSGATQEAWDAVRYVSNHSSGKQGHAVAAALAQWGAQTTIISGVQAAATVGHHPAAQLVTVRSAADMHQAVMESLPADIVVMAAAVADWRPQTIVKGKMESQSSPPPIGWVKNRDILADVARHELRPSLLIGFAAHYGWDVAAARQKKKRKNCDWLVVNDISGDVMGGDDNEVCLISERGEERWQSMPKQQVAAQLVERIGAFFANTAKKM